MKLKHYVVEVLKRGEDGELRVIHTSYCHTELEASIIEAQLTAQDTNNCEIKIRNAANIDYAAQELELISQGLRDYLHLTLLDPDYLILIKPEDIIKTLQNDVSSVVKKYY